MQIESGAWIARLGGGVYVEVLQQELPIAGWPKTGGSIKANLVSRPAGSVSVARFCAEEIIAPPPLAAMSPQQPDFNIAIIGPLTAVDAPGIITANFCVELC